MDTLAICIAVAGALLLISLLTSVTIVAVIDSTVDNTDVDNGERTDERRPPNQREDQPS